MRWKISTNTVDGYKTDTKCAHSIYGRPTQKHEEHFRNRLVHKPYERSLYERTFMSVQTFHRETCYSCISTELCNVNREKHKLKSHRVCRRDREPSRIPISLRNKSRKVREFVYARILSCFPMSSTLYCCVNAKNIFKKKKFMFITVVVDLVKV